jgi:hypothetical protein
LERGKNMVKCPNHCRTDRSGTGDGERIDG